MIHQYYNTAVHYQRDSDNTVEIRPKLKYSEFYWVTAGSPVFGWHGKEGLVQLANRVEVFFITLILCRMKNHK